jgi:hypothetical protein
MVGSIEGGCMSLSYIYVIASTHGYGEYSRPQAAFATESMSRAAVRLNSV